MYLLNKSKLYKIKKTLQIDCSANR